MEDEDRHFSSRGGDGEADDSSDRDFSIYDGKLNISWVGEIKKKDLVELDDETCGTVLGFNKEGIVSMRPLDSDEIIYTGVSKVLRKRDDLREEVSQNVLDTLEQASIDEATKNSLEDANEREQLEELER